MLLKRAIHLLEVATLSQSYRMTALRLQSVDLFYWITDSHSFWKNLFESFRSFLRRLNRFSSTENRNLSLVIVWKKFRLQARKVANREVGHWVVDTRFFQFTHLSVCSIRFLQIASVPRWYRWYRACPEAYTVWISVDTKWAIKWNYVNELVEFKLWILMSRLNQTIKCRQIIAFWKFQDESQTVRF